MAAPRLSRLIDFAQRPTVAATNTFFGILAGVAMVAGWLYLAADSAVDRFLPQAVARAEADTRGRMSELEAENRQLRQVVADQARGLATVAAAGREPASPPVGEDRVVEALRQAAAGDRSGAETILREVADYRAARAERAGETAAAERAWAAETYRELGALAWPSDTERALAAFYRAVGLDPGDVWTWMVIAELEQQVGHLKPAEEAARRARDSAIVAGDEQGAMVADKHIGDNYFLRGDLVAAERHYQSAMIVAVKHTINDPSNAPWQLNLVECWQRLGDVRRAQGDLAEAVVAYGKTHTILSKLASVEPNEADWKSRLLSVSWLRLGDVRIDQGDLAGALQAYEEGQAIRERLAKANTGDASRQRDLAVSWGKMAGVRQAQADLTGALEAVEQSRAILSKLVEIDPSNTDWQYNLSLSLGKMGEVRASQGDLFAALASYENFHAILSKLTAAEPNNVKWQRDKIIFNVKSAEARAGLGDGVAVTAHYREALRVARAMLAEGRLAPKDSWLVPELERRLTASERP